MAIAVFSDSHGAWDGIARALRGGPYGMAIHLGDFVRDARELAAEFPGIPFECVAGNCDGWGVAGVGHEKVLDVLGHKLFLTHGHLQHVNQGTRLLQDAAGRNGCEAALFGHTHVPMNEHRGRVLCLNPGRASSPRGGAKRPTFAILEIDGPKLRSRLEFIP
jgi:putative phosphoesterase